MRCFRCGGEAPSGDVCPHCGQVLSGGAPPVSSAQPPGEKTALNCGLYRGGGGCRPVRGRSAGVWPESPGGLPFLPLLVLCGVFAAFFALDLAGHRLLRIARGAAHWCVLAVVAAGMLCAGTGAALSLTGAGDRRMNLDFAYRYLLDGHGEIAREKAAFCPEEDRAVLTLLADAVDREYLSAYFEADRLLQEGGLDSATAVSVRELRALSAGVLGLSIDAETGEPTGRRGGLAPRRRGGVPASLDRRGTSGADAGAGARNLRPAGRR